MTAAAMDNPTSPFDDAVTEIVERGELAGASSPETTGSDPFASPAPPPEPEAPKRRGRPVNPNSRRARSGKYAGNGTAQSAPVEGPPPPAEPKRAYTPIPPEAVAETIRRLDERVVAAFGTEPLTKDEIKGGGDVFAPVIDHYMPLLTEGGGLWMAPLAWVLLAYGPRAWQALEDRQRDKTRGITSEAQTGEAGNDNFREGAARPLAVVSK